MDESIRSQQVALRESRESNEAIFALLQDGLSNTTSGKKNKSQDHKVHSRDLLEIVLTHATKDNND